MTVSYRRAIAVAVLMGVLGLAVWSLVTDRGGSSSIDARVRAIASGLRCPVCQNLSVADSPSDLARDMRTAIRTQLEAGETPAQIRRFFVERYGEWIVFEPPARGAGVFPWIAPSLALLGGAVLVSVIARRWRRSDAAAVSPEDRERISHALSRLDGDEAWEP